jgi:hypothetical protein
MSELLYLTVHSSIELVLGITCSGQDLHIYDFEMNFNMLKKSQVKNFERQAFE